MIDPAETGRRIAERAIAYGSQLASTVVQGVAEGTDWRQRIISGLAGASPALPNAPIRCGRIRRWLARVLRRMAEKLDPSPFTGIKRRVREFGNPFV